MLDMEDRLQPNALCSNGLLCNALCNALLCSLCLICTVLATACGGASPADLERSSREFELAASLHREGNQPSAIEHLRRAIELDEANAEAHILLGVIQYERRNLPSAEENVRNGIHQLEVQERAGATLAESRNMLGVILLDSAQYDAAAEVLRLSAMDEMNRAPHLAWGNLGLARLEQERYDEAMESLQAAVRAQPRFCIGYFRMGRAYFEQNDMERAEQALNQALEADEECGNSPFLQGAWRMRGEVRARLGHRDEALADFVRCVELGQNTEDATACQRFLDGPGGQPNSARPEGVNDPIDDGAESEQSAGPSGSNP